MARKSGQDRGLWERDGWWWIDYHYQGKRYREKVAPVASKGSKAKARARYMQRKEECRAGKFDGTVVSAGGRQAPITVGEVLEHYLPEHCRGKARPGEEEQRAAWWSERIGQVPAAALVPGQVEQARAQLLEEGLKPATANRYLSTLQRLLNLAVRDDLVERNPASKVRKLEENNERVRWPFTAEERARLVEHLPDWAWRMARIAIVTGMRQGEQFNLRREHLRLEERFAIIPRAKGNKARFVALSSEAVGLLEEVLAEHDSEWVFPNSTGRRPLDAHNFYNRTWKPATEAAGFPDLHWHDLRHVFAAERIQDGRNTKTVADLLGHASLAMMRRYAHLSPGYMIEAVEPVRESTATGTATGAAARNGKCL